MRKLIMYPLIGCIVLLALWWAGFTYIAPASSAVADVYATANLAVPGPFKGLRIDLARNTSIPALAITPTTLLTLAGYLMVIGAALAYLGERRDTETATAIIHDEGMAAQFAAASTAADNDRRLIGSNATRDPEPRLSLDKGPSNPAGTGGFMQPPPGNAPVD